MTGPMVLLAGLAVVSGWIGLPEGFLGLPVPDLFGEFVAPSQFAAETLALEPHSFGYGLAILSVVMAVAGIGMAYLLYVQKPSRAGALAQRFSGLHRFLDKGWYFDALYGATFVRGANALARATGSLDRRVIGGAIDGVGRGVGWTGKRLRSFQGGGVQSYVFVILLGVLAIGILAGAQGVVLVAALVALATVAAIAVGARL